MKNIEKTLYTETTITPEGELVSAKMVTKSTEPEYVKLYIDCVFTLKGLRKGLNPIFLAFLPYMSYADICGIGGGQIIFVNKTMKETIAKKLNIGLVSVNNAITAFVKNDIFKRISNSTYQVNPNIVGKGEWKDIKSIRATFDFGTKDIVAEIIKDENETVTMPKEQLTFEDLQGVTE